tara:strand:+ start:403 stop:1104 length:702 start_codon:yes stop_codon:yes gene_type:complete
MKKLLLPLLLASSVSAEQRNYDEITNRNAFALLDEAPAKVELPKLLEKPPVKLNLTGIMKYRGQTNVYLFSQDISKRFLMLNQSRPTDSGVTLISVSRGLVKVNNNGVTELLSFSTHKLPTVVTKPALSQPTVIKKNKKENSKSVKILPTPKEPNIIKVPSRNRGITDPRMQSMMEKGLEYLNRIEDPKKKEQMLERIEKFQRGDYDKEIKERMKRYEEYRKSRDRKSENKKK